MFGWRFRTLSMFIVMTAILMGIGALISLCVGGLTTNRVGIWYIIMGVMFTISMIMCFVSYFFSKEMALKMNRARVITERDNPRFYGIVREVAEKAGLPMPEVGITISGQPNAFATGRDPKHAAVVATSSLLDMLPDDELRGVIAHEMSHVRNRDVAVMSIASAMALIVTYATSILRMMAFSNAFRNNNENAAVKIGLVVGAVAAEILVPIAALLVQMGISRNREFLADETGAKIISDPRALARALDHLENGISKVNSYTIDEMESRSRSSGNGTKAFNPADNYQSAHMWIANPLAGKKSVVGKLFSTHPPMEERIARLNKLAEQMGQ